MSGDPSEQVEPLVAAFPLQWDSASWQRVDNDPEASIADLTDAVLHLEARLTSHIPDASTRSALIVVEGIADVAEFRSVVTPRMGGGATWIPWKRWFTQPHVLGGHSLWVEEDLILGQVGSVSEIHGSMIPRAFNCSWCHANLSREPHLPDCPWR